MFSGNEECLPGYSWLGMGVWYEMWLMIHTSAQGVGRGSIPHKVGCEIIQRAALRGLLGINWPVSLLWLQVLLSLSSADCSLCTLSLLRSFAVNVSQGKLRQPKNTLASHMDWLSGLWGPSAGLVPAVRRESSNDLYVCLWKTEDTFRSETFKQFVDANI